MNSLPQQSDALRSFLQQEDQTLTHRWEELLSWLDTRFGRQASIESILFLIGIQSRGQGYRPKLSKKAKQDLIMEGTHCAFETVGLYRRIGTNEKGHVIWERSGPAIPKLPLPEQEKLLQIAILSYFDGIRSSA